MNEGGTSRIPGKLAKGIGWLTMVLGSALVLLAFFPVKQFLSGDKDWMDYLITSVAVMLMVIPGALVILGGYQFFREVNLPNLKVLVGVYAAFVSLFCFSKVEDWYPDLWHQRMLTGGFFFGAALFAILIYLLALRWLVPATGMRWNGCRSVLGKGAFTLLAWLLFMALFPVARAVLPSTSLIVLLGPISVAWGFHMLAVKWLKNGRQISTP